MRFMASVVMLTLLGGCSNGPTLSGGKPIDHWLHALDDADAKVRKIAVQKLGNAGASNPAVFPALQAALKDRDADVRCEVILALVKFGPQLKAAVPALTDLLQNDPEAKVRDYASKALQKIAQNS